MKLLEHEAIWSAPLQALGASAVTLRAGVSNELAAVPYLRERLKLSVRAFVHQAHTRPWLRMLNSHPAFAEYVQNCPKLLHKIYRPYLTANLDMERRRAVLASHYRIMLGHGLGQTIAHASRSGVPLASIDGKSGTTYRIELRAIAPLEREGELVLQLFDGATLVYSIAFTFSDLDGARIVSVGCIQGPKHGDGLAAIRAATRDLHGLRPKQLMVGLVRQLGYELGCTHMRLVGNANRVVRGAMREGRVLADYDQLWRELGARERHDGDFEIACAPLPELALEQICSKKRSEARKRHKVTVELNLAVARQFCQRAPLAGAAANDLPASAPACRPVRSGSHG